MLMFKFLQIIPFRFRNLKILTLGRFQYIKARVNEFCIGLEIDLQQQSLISSSMQANFEPLETGGFNINEPLGVDHLWSYEF